MSLARAGLGLSLAFVGGCSLVSGWSDLQDGTPPSSGGDGGSLDSATSSGGDAGSSSGSDSGAPTGSDAGTTGDSGSGDAAASSADASGVPMTVLCGTTRCSTGEGCCTVIPAVGGSPTCQAPTAACNVPNAFEQCSDSSQCRGLSPTAVCCSGTSGAELVVSCTANCTMTMNGTGSIVCDPTLPSPSCPAGKTCQPDPEFDYNSCQ